MKSVQTSQKHFSPAWKCHETKCGNQNQKEFLDLQVRLKSRNIIKNSFNLRKRMLMKLSSIQAIQVIKFHYEVRLTLLCLQSITDNCLLLLLWVTSMWDLKKNFLWNLRLIDNEILPDTLAYTVFGFNDTVSLFKKSRTNKQ